MEETYFAQKRNIKRRLMESGGGHQVGAEIRRLHVIYFLSRNGRIEHPHLIRVHHLSRNGVHLRDVKRWLAELRGKDMPESFAWSYKRRYKSGYVWQDLLDEDLITPISDNEYVLKGSEISSTPSIEDSNIEKKYSMQKEEEDHSDHSPSFQEGHHQENPRQEPRKMPSSSPEVEEEDIQTYGSEKYSTLTDDSLKLEDQEQEKQSSCDQSFKQEMHPEVGCKVEKPSLYKNLSKKKMNKKSNNIDVAASDEKSCSPTSASSTSQPAFSKSRSYSNGASHLFRNLITCGAIDTNDSAMVTINRRNKASVRMDFSSDSKHDGDSADFSKELLHEGDKLGGSQRVFGTNWNQQRQPSGRKSFDGVRASPKNKSDQFGSQKANPAYKPIYGPQCSQCGRPFKPEKLHAHMKSCKGMKAWAKHSVPGIAANAAEMPAETSAKSQDNLIPGYYLTH